MSARTPFIPSNNARPASRATHAMDQGAAIKSGINAEFAPNRNNPLHLNKTSQQASSTENDTVVLKPLNLNGLLKKRSSATGGPVRNSSGSRRASGEKNASDQAAANARQMIRDQAGTPLLLAPKPVVAAHSPLFSNATGSPAFNAHPFRTSAPTDPQNSPNQKDAHAATTDNQTNFGEFQFNLSLPGQTGPQRLLLNEQMPQQMLGLIPKHSNKRGRAAFEGDDEVRRAETEGGKRYKTPATQEDYMDEINCTQHSFSPQPFSSPIEGSQSGYRGYPQTIPNEASVTLRRHTSSIPPQQHSRGMPGLQARGAMNSSGDNEGYDTLDKLLGCQADAYVERHMDVYEAMVSKWKECTMDEWMNGADEIMSKYSKILDFVKEHMASKLKLFTSFDAKVDAHNVILSERAKDLDEAKQKLVAHSGDILGCQ